jgi:hypothetical protein
LSATQEQPNRRADIPVRRDTGQNSAGFCETLFTLTGLDRPGKFPRKTEFVLEIGAAQAGADQEPTVMRLTWLASLDSPEADIILKK